MTHPDIEAFADGQMSEPDREVAESCIVNDPVLASRVQEIKNLTVLLRRWWKNYGEN